MYIGSKQINSEKLKKIFKYLLIGCIFLYPFIHTFIGLDLGDTGSHYFGFERLFTQTEFLSFTSYFTSLVGWGWLQIFGGLGLWGLNLLEVIVEMLMAFMVYKVFSPWLGENKTLIGILVAVLASDTYLNVFNYHQFNVLWLVFILCMEFYAITKDNKKYSCLSGAALAVVFFSRTGSITALVTLVLYVVWYLFEGKSTKFLIRHLSSFVIAFIVTAAAFIGLLYGTNQLDDFINNVFRLSTLATTTDGGYSIGNLLSTFIFGNLDAMASGFIFLSAFLILVVGISLLIQKENVKRKVINVFIALLLVFIAGYQLKYAYDVNPAKSWPQMTSGPAFIIGLFYVTAVICMLIHLYSAKGKREIALLCIISIVLPLLTIAGSNTGTKHVILGLWMIAPISVYTVLSVFEGNDTVEHLAVAFSGFGIIIKKAGVYAALIIMIGAFGIKFVDMLYYTTNFDSVDRSLLNSYVNNEKVKWIRTTEREADAVNGVLESTAKFDKERPLMVFGGSLMFYTMTERESFVQPWVSNSVYNNDVLIQHMEQESEKEDNLPVVIYCRTNNYYGFYEYNYNSLIEAEKNNWWEGKKDIITEFLNDNNYQLQYLNDYYMVLAPPDIAEKVDDDYMRHIRPD